MATLHRADNVLVLRIVYDGLAEAGKTTTLRTLSGRLASQCVTPEESDGRTVFFDWFEYRGGRFEGCELQCQVVSVPGQRSLARRRQHLLASADAVVQVASIDSKNLDETIARLQRVKRELDGTPPVGMVLQANKRDLPGALPLVDLREALSAASLPLSVIESTASLGHGVREAFVFAVRLALDHVRELMDLGQLPEGPPKISSPEGLLAELRANEMSPSLRLGTERSSVDSSSPMASALRSVEGSNGTSTSVETPNGADVGPRTPNATVPSGCIWPPVDGRVYLADATETTPTLTRIASGYWGTTASGWRFFSREEDRYEKVEAGRQRLLENARTHALHARLVSHPRCLVLAADGNGAWRLWQIVRERLSMRDRLALILGESDSTRVADTLFDTVRRVLELEEKIAEVPNSPVKASLDTTGVFSGQTLYVGLMTTEQMPQDSRDPTLQDEIRAALEDLPQHRLAVVSALSRKRSEASRSRYPSSTLEVLEVLEGALT